mgnify:CR=1 FL=1
MFSLERLNSNPLLNVPLRYHHIYKFFNIIVMLSTLTACQYAFMTKEENSITSSENDWADVPVQLSRTPEDFSLVLQSYSLEQENNSSPKFALYAIAARSAPIGRKYRVYYVDTDVNGKLTSITWKLRTKLQKVSSSYKVTAWMDFSADKKLPNARWMKTIQNNGTQSIKIGTVYFEKKGQTKVISNQQFFKGMIISDETFLGNGQIALHLLSKIDYQPTSLFTNCHGSTLSKSCNNIDLSKVCEASLLSAGCIENLTKADEVFLATGSSDNLGEYGNTGIRTLNLRTNSEAEGELTFVSQNINATTQNNQELCRDVVRWHVSSLIDQTRNLSCIIGRVSSPAPFEGKLQCKIKISFTNFKDISQYGCMVHATFIGEKKEFQSASVVAVN